MHSLSFEQAADCIYIHILTCMHAWCRFSGSTLEVMGIVVETGEWAVVGGTGQFAMATGVISKRLLEQRSAAGGQIIELTIRAFCPVLKGPRVRYIATIINYICFLFIFYLYTCSCSSSR